MFSMVKFLSGKKQTLQHHRNSYQVVFLVLIQINNLPYVRMSICKIFADDASLFSKSLDINKSVRTPNRDLDEVSECCTRIYRIPTSSSVFIQYMKKKIFFPLPLTSKRFAVLQEIFRVHIFFLTHSTGLKQATGLFELQFFKQIFHSDRYNSLNTSNY